MTTVETTQPIASDYSYSEDDFDGYSAAPLLIIGKNADPTLVAKQDEIGRNFNQLVHSELDQYLKPGVVEFVAHSITTRMHQREGLNCVSYLDRPNNAPHFIDHHLSGDEVAEACENLKSGCGTVLQNEIARKAFGMPSVEYANLTIIGDSRKQLEAAMWDEVSELTGEDAAPDADKLTAIKILGYDRDIRSDINISAMRIGMKQNLGVTEYGAQVKARTTAIIRPIALLRNMGKSAEDYYALVNELQSAAKGFRTPLDIPEFVTAVKWLVGNTLPGGIVLARNETVYGIEETL